jgi:hypothetical protein
MNKSTRALNIVSGVGLGLVMLVGISVLAEAGPAGAQPGATRSMGELTHESVVVTSIDRAKRTATLQNPEGETKTVTIPADVKAFDTVKVGDHIDIDYYESMALEVLPKGSKPSMSQRTSRMGTGTGAGGMSKETNISAEIVSVDTNNNKVTFKGPQGETRTVSVSDPDIQKRLPDLKPGQVVQLTYTEAVAASLRKTGKGAESRPMEKMGHPQQQQPQQQPHQ